MCSEHVFSSCAQEKCVCISCAYLFYSTGVFFYHTQEYFTYKIIASISHAGRKQCSARGRPISIHRLQHVNWAMETPVHAFRNSWSSTMSSNFHGLKIPSALFLIFFYNSKARLLQVESRRTMTRNELSKKYTDIYILTAVLNASKFLN